MTMSDIRSYRDLMNRNDEISNSYYRSFEYSDDAEVAENLAYAYNADN